MECRISDATTGTVGKDRFKWVKCELLEGKVSDLDDNFLASNSVLVEYMRAYYIEGKIIEKLNQEKFYYKKQIRGV